MGSEQIKMRKKRLTTLTTHLRKFEKPAPNGYDAFATSYISNDVPWKKILSNEVDTETVEPVPFSPIFEIEKFDLQEKERKLCGESVRKKEILPSSYDIFRHFKEAEIQDRNEHLGYLYFKAMQYSNLNKALALDEAYPKPDSNVLRSTFSKVHQKVVSAMHNNNTQKNIVLAAKEDLPGSPSCGQSENLFILPNLDSIITKGDRTMAIVGEQDDLSSMRQVIKDALDKQTSFKDYQMHTEPWQFKAKSGRNRVPMSKQRKFAWKRNTYPPKTIEERIADLRSRAPPLLPEYLETDQLPGVWEPELMIDTFKTSYVEAQEEGNKEFELNWWKMFNINKKCLKWLESIPDTL